MSYAPIEHDGLIGDMHTAMAATLALDRALSGTRRVAPGKPGRAP